MSERFDEWLRLQKKEIRGTISYHERARLDALTLVCGEELDDELDAGALESLMEEIALRDGSSVEVAREGFQRAVRASLAES